MDRPEFIVRVGCRLRYNVPKEAPTLFKLKPRRGPAQFVAQESLKIGGSPPAEEHEDRFGNIANRVLLPQGEVEVVHDAIVSVPTYSDAHDRGDDPAVS